MPKHIIHIMVFGFLLILLGLPVRGQQYHYAHYTSVDGLLQNQVRSVHQDTAGFLWFGTKLGISRFDGRNFKNSGRTSGILPGDIQQIAEDRHQNLWFLSRQGLITYQRDSFINYRTPSSYYSLKNMQVTGDSIFVHVRYKKGQDQLLCFHKGRYHSTELPAGNYTHAAYLPQSHEFLVRTHKSGIKAWRPASGFDDTPWTHTEASLSLHPHKVFIIAGKKIYRYGAQARLIAEVPFTVKKLRYTNEHLFLIPEKEDSIYEYSLSGSFIDSYPFPKSNDVWVTASGMRWFATEKGIFKLSSRAFTHFPNETTGIRGSAWNIAEDGNSFWLGTYSGRLYRFKYGKASRVDPGIPVNHFYPPSLQMGEGSLLFGAKNGLVIKNQRGFGKKFQHTLDAVLDIYHDTLQNCMVFGVGKGFAVHKNSRLQKYTVNNHKWKLSAVTAIEKDTLGNYWLATRRGLARFNGREIKYFTDSLFQYGALSAFHDHRHNLWFGGEGGLIFYNNKRFKKLSCKRFKNKAITALHTIGDTLLLAGTTSGMEIINLKAFYREGSLTLKQYNHRNGFSGEECQQNSFITDKSGNIWIPLTDEIIRINPELLHLRVRPPVPKIKGIQHADGKKWESHKNPDKPVSHTHERLRIAFTAPYYAGTVQYSYKLEGANNSKTWSVPQTSPNAVFRELKHGQYKFQVKAVTPCGLESKSKSAIRFQVDAAFWQLLWVRWLSILFIAALVSFLVIRYHQGRIRKQREKQQTAHRQRMLMMQARLAQLDPHFIFNTLTSTGTKALQNNGEQAYNMIVKLAGLLRQHWQGSVETTRPLSEELALVEKYCELAAESNRQKFSYQIHVEKNVDTSIQVIKLSIQNFAENAIKHGIENIEHHGLLKIEVKQNAQYVIIHVEDNGIGYKAANRLDTLNNHSGLKNLRTAMELYNEQNSQKMFYRIYDKSDDKPTTNGTIVQLYVPLTFQYA